MRTVAPEIGKREGVGSRLVCGHNAQHLVVSALYPSASLGLSSAVFLRFPSNSFVPVP